MKRCLHCDKPRVPTVSNGRIIQPKGLLCPRCKARNLAQVKRVYRLPEHQRPPYTDAAAPAPGSMPPTVDPIDWLAFLARTREALEESSAPDIE